MSDRRAEFASRFPGAIILPFDGSWPEIADDAFIAPGAVLVGNVTVGSQSSVWFNTTIRGDIAPVTIGARTSVQDNTVVHVNKDAPTTVGDDVTIGHSALVHGTTIHDGAMIGMGSLVLSYSVIGKGAVIAAGALIPERHEVPDGAVMIGIPAKQRDKLGEEQIERLAGIPDRYVRVSRRYIGIVNGTTSGEEEDATSEY
ncbi:MAG TPA: gamma carbonic anhydrase family protein [Thermomicrobiales bacterium]|nr:gamma carbonic anhydrase family protein [Thermomicrobiales bacterium]